MSDERHSKFLSFILRHKPQTIGAVLDKSGWININELIQKCNDSGHKIDRKIIERVVANNNKKRFEIVDENIRASQGHSVKVDLEYKEKIPPRILYHGTALKSIGSIMDLGIEKMSRHHVHLSTNIQTAKQVGSRHGEVIILEIDSSQMYIDGYKFFESTNGVWLTDHIPPKYIYLIAKGSKDVY